VVLVGDANRAHASKNMTQEANQVEILRPAVKALIRIEDGARIPELVRRAYGIATSGRPGPVVLDVPEDVCHGTFEFEAADFAADSATLQIPARRIRPDGDALAQAARFVGGARRPLILAGGGIHLSGAYEALRAFAEGHNIPVAHTMSGKGGLACSHPLSAGLFGRYARIANELIAASDCLIAVGCKLGEIATKRYSLIPAQTPLVHIDIEAAELGRWRLPQVALWADARAALEDLTAELSEAAPAARRARADYAAEVPARMAAWRDEAESRLESNERPINMARVVQELNRALPAEAILVADGGFAGHWTGLLYDTNRAGRGYIANRGFASIGYGLPGALGAQLAAPTRPVVGVTGDGGLNMVLGELETALRAGAGFTLVVVNNAASGYVKALQHAMFAGRYQSADLTETDYAKVAEALGCQGIRIEDPAELAPALATGMAETTRPTLLDVVVTRDPAKMLPGVDSRTLEVKPGDRPV
jgi:acetolactate synthase-1/2/3 large subunit